MYHKILFLLVLGLSFSACSSTKEPQTSLKCIEKPETGKCRAMFHKYYYNKSEDKCKSFIWGGCGGNIPFHTLQKCQETCEK